jgi:hypothetical protein
LNISSGKVADFEGEATLAIRPAGDRKHLSTDLPDMRSTPLHHAGGRRQGPTERIEFFKGHFVAAILARLSRSCRIEPRKRHK